MRQAVWVCVSLMIFLVGCGDSRQVAELKAKRAALKAEFSEQLADLNSELESWQQARLDRRAVPAGGDGRAVEKQEADLREVGREADYLDWVTQRLKAGEVLDDEAAEVAAHVARCQEANLDSELATRQAKVIFAENALTKQHQAALAEIDEQIRAAGGQPPGER